MPSKDGSEDGQRLTGGCGVDAGVESGVELEDGLERSTCTSTLTGSEHGSFREVGVSIFTAVTPTTWGEARGEGGGGRGGGGVESCSPELVDNSLVDFLAAVSGAAGGCERKLCLAKLSLGAMEGLQLPWTHLSTKTGSGSPMSPLQDSFC